MAFLLLLSSLKGDRNYLSLYIHGQQVENEGNGLKSHSSQKAWLNISSLFSWVCFSPMVCLNRSPRFCPELSSIDALSLVITFTVFNWHIYGCDPQVSPPSFFLGPNRWACGSSQIRHLIRAAAASLRHSHSNTGSKLCPRPTPRLTARPDPQSTEGGQGLNPHPHRHNVGFLTCWATVGAPSSLHF